MLTVTDVSGNTSTCLATVKINKRPTTLVYTGDGSEQYSDQQVLTAILKDFTGVVLSGKTISFVIGTQSASNATDVNGIATANLILRQDPAPTYTVKSNFAGDPVFMQSSDEDAFDITQEDADVTYTGNTYFTLPSTTATSMNVPVTDIVKDISALTGDPKYDVFAGDISKANITFSIGTASPLTVPVVLLNTTDKSTGTANASYNVSLSNTELSSGGKSITVNSKAGAFYKNSTDAILPQVVTVATPGTGFVSGGGYILSPSPSGFLAPAVGDRTNFGFTMQYTKSGSNLKGQCNIIMRSKGKVYQIKSTAVNTLSIDATGLKGYFNTKANITDITDPLNTKSVYDPNGVALPGGLDLTVWINDVSQGGQGDQVAIQLFNGSQLVYSSNWVSNKTTLQNLNGGNISVRIGGAVAPIITTDKQTISTSIAKEVNTTLKVAVYPNPAFSRFTVKFIGGNVEEPARVRIFNQLGQIVETRNAIYVGQSFQTGTTYKQGIYLVEIIQGAKKQTLKLIKTAE
jgi:hypothetical protein